MFGMFIEFCTVKILGQQMQKNWHTRPQLD